MTTIRCGNCSFLNFATASACKRCKAEFQTVPAQVGTLLSAQVETTVPAQLDTTVPAQTGNAVPVVDEASCQPGYQASFSQATTFQATQQWQQPAFQSPFPPPPNYFQPPVAPLPRASKHGPTNAALGLLFGLAVALIFSFGVFRKASNHTVAVNFAWQQYASPDGSYTVLMPNHPSESVQSQFIPAGEIRMHISEVDMGERGAFMVAYADYPGKPSNVSSQEILDAGAQGAVSKSNSFLLSKKNITLDGHPGIELELAPPTGQGLDGGIARARLYWVAPRLYIMFTGVQKPTDEAAMIKFLDSFQLSKR